MLSSDKALAALMHSIALLSKANGDSDEMKTILSRCRADNSSASRRIELHEDFTNPPLDKSRRQPEKCVVQKIEIATKLVSAIDKPKDTFPGAERLNCRSS